MAIDANIALGYKPPDIMGADERMKNAQTLQAGKMELDAKTSALKDQEQARQIMMQAGGDHNKAIQDLNAAGLSDEAQKLQKFVDERTAAGDVHSAAAYKLSSDKHDRIGQAYGAVAQAPDEQIHNVAWQAIDGLTQNGDVTPEWANQTKQSMANMSAQELRQNAQTGFQQVLKAKDQLPKPSIVNLVGTQQPVVQSIYGAVTPVGQPMQVTQSPQSIEANKVTMRGQDMTAATAANKLVQAQTSADATDIALSDDAIKNAAANFNTFGTLPTLGMGKKSALQKAQIMNQAALMSAGIDPMDLAASRAGNKSNAMALTQNSKDLAAITPYKEMLDKNADIAIDLAKKVTMTNSAFANKTLNWIKQNAGDNPDTSEYLAQMNFVQTEAARVLNNPRLVGQLSDTARQEMEQVVNGNMPLNATERVLKRIKQDGDNRVNAMLSEHDNLLKSFKKSFISQPTNSQPAKLPPTNKQGWVLHQDKVTKAYAYVSPDGKQYQEVK